MKNLVVVSLLVCATAVAASSDPNCKYCKDVAFVFAAQDAVATCPNQLRNLQSRLDAATTDAQVDQAWSTFCTGSCPTYVNKIDDDHTCCMGEYTSMAMNIRHACSRSVNVRYCGAEISNLNKASCNATDIDTCIKGSCQWDTVTSKCFFNGDAKAIAGMCTDCNRKYFENFFAGGIYEPKEHAKIAAKYSTFCTTHNGTSSYGLAAVVGFRLADELAASDSLNNVCVKTNAGRRTKLALRTSGVFASRNGQSALTEVACAMRHASGGVLTTSIKPRQSMQAPH